MKKNLRLILFFTAALMIQSSMAQTTVTSGNWTSPSTWGGMPPTGTGTVIINHAVTLDMDYSHTAGSITIGNNGSLNGNSVMRAFALNYPSGTATLTVNGSMDVARTAIISNTVAVSGTLSADSLLMQGTITINSSGNVNTEQFFNDLTGTINNSGDIVTINLLTIGTATNTGNITADDFANSKTFTNNSAGVMTINYDWYNGDTITSPASFTNNGVVTVGHDWHNDNAVSGSGSFCVANNSWNSGTMTGTFDFCDQTGSDPDVNSGTIAGTVTYCTVSCTVGENEINSNFVFTVYPNPAHNFVTVSSDTEFINTTLEMVNSLGEIVYQTTLNGNNRMISLPELSSGMYFLKLHSENGLFTKTIVIE